MTTRHEQHGASTFILFLVAGGALLVLPGLLAGFVVDDILHLNLDRGQLWTLGSSLTGGTFLVAWLTRGFVSAAGLHCAACVASVWIVTVGHFGVHAAWAATFLNRVFAIG